MILVGLAPSIPLASNIPPLCPVDVGVAGYAIGYVLLEPVAGILMLPYHLVTLYYAHVLPMQYPTDVILRYALGLHLTAWVAQFLGHGLREGRAPSLFNNIFQVFTPGRGLTLVCVFSAIVCVVGSFICVWV
jgi:uncharacterized membrane protein YGL010W